MACPPNHSTNDDTNNSCLQEDLMLCSVCGQNLCIREITINLALGNTEIMYCLKCLGTKEKKNPEEILAKIKKYIMARECFHKEWIKYKNISDCPKPESCFPSTCFGKQ
jgi:hypothetical protein